MKTLRLGHNLEAVDMGAFQQELADYVVSHPVWAAYVEKVNSQPIPCAGGGIPDPQWLEGRIFHPDDLLAEACEKLGWHSQPPNGGLIEDYYYEESDVLARVSSARMAALPNK